MDRSKIKLTALLLVIVLPITLATVTFMYREGKGFGSTTNKGRLISPVMDITEFGMRNAEGAAMFQVFEEMVEGVDPSDYKVRPWLLVYIGTEVCDDDCVERLYFLRQLHTRLGADSSRLQRYYLKAGEGDLTLNSNTETLFATDFPEMVVAGTDETALRAKLARTHGEEEDPVAAHYIYVVDPVGNVMLYFTPENGPEQILDDVENLLDRSSLG